jgi:hypothetical protein
MVPENVRVYAPDGFVTLKSIPMVLPGVIVVSCGVQEIERPDVVVPPPPPPLPPPPPVEVAVKLALTVLSLFISTVHVAALVDVHPVQLLKIYPAFGTAVSVAVAPDVYGDVLPEIVPLEAEVVRV